MRGKHNKNAEEQKKKRNIPAYAGKRLPTDNANPYMRNIPAYAGKT